MINYDQSKLTDLCLSQGVEFLLLHGSCVSGQRGPESDVDVAVFFGPNFKGSQEAAFMDGLTEMFGDRCDLAVLNRADPMLCYQAALGSKILFERHPGLVEAFRSNAIRRYQDTAKFRRLERYFIEQTVKKFKKELPYG